MEQPRGLFPAMREKLRTCHLGCRSGQAHWHRARRFVRLHGQGNPREFGPNDVEGFLTHLATRRKPPSPALQCLAQRFQPRGRADVRPGAVVELARQQSTVGGGV